MSTTITKGKSPAFQKLIKKYGEKKVDWKKLAHKLTAFKDININAEKLRSEAWKTGSTN